MSTNTASQQQVGELVELARYTVSTGGRVIYGQRVNGVVRVTDRPAQGRGRSVLIERELELDGNNALKALVADYVAQALLHDEVPLLRTLI